MRVIALLAILCLALVACSPAPAEVEEKQTEPVKEVKADTTADDLAALDADLAALEEEDSLLAEDEFEFEFE